MGLAWGFAYFFTVSLFERFKVEKTGLSSLYVGAFFSSWIGAKFFYLWFSSGPKIYEYIYAQYFWLGGGFVFYGGLIFGLTYYAYWTLGLKKFSPENGKYLLPGLAFGHAIGRVGCFLAGCCYGVRSDSFLAMKFQDAYRLPVQLGEAVVALLIGIYILNKIKSNSKNILTIYVVLYSISRFGLEFFRGDEIRGVFLFGLSSSQWLSLAFMALFIIPFLLKRHQNH